MAAEQLVKERFPYVRYVRIHTDGANKATIYAWNEDLQLTDKELRSLKQFAADYISPYVCFKVKPFHYVQTDKVPEEPRLPEPVMKAALDRSLSHDDVLELLSRLFHYGVLSLSKWDPAAGIVHFGFSSGRPVLPEEKASLPAYLNELVPIGLKAEVVFES